MAMLSTVHDTFAGVPVNGLFGFTLRTFSPKEGLDDDPRDAEAGEVGREKAESDEEQLWDEDKARVEAAFDLRETGQCGHV